jgi:hypothetical protein
VCHLYYIFEVHANRNHIDSTSVNRIRLTIYPLIAGMSSLLDLPEMKVLNLLLNSKGNVRPEPEPDELLAQFEIDKHNFINVDWSQ